MTPEIRTASMDDFSFDPNDVDSVLRHASKLTGHTMRQMLVSRGVDDIDIRNGKGSMGNLVEEGWFDVAPNSRAEPDLPNVRIEIKVSPIKYGAKGHRVKERMVLGIIDYNEVPDKRFRIFSDKNSHLLIVFYRWEAGTASPDYKVIKVVFWEPDADDLRMIKEDWDVIESYIMSGRAHELSERHTKLLAACTKGVGHGADLRKQPFSDKPAKQRALSFKPSYVEHIFNNWDDVNVILSQSGCQSVGDDSTSVSVMGGWSESESFERHILNRFEHFVGMDCRAIEEALCVRLNPDSKSYYSDLARAMVGVVGKKRIKEFDQAGITMKTIRMTRNLSSKESMSFPYIRYDRLVDETWDDSDFFEQLDTMFFSPVFQFKTSQTEGVDRRDLVFAGAFFWALGEEDMEAAESVWADTRDKVRRGEIGGFVSISDDRGFHLRPHGRDSRDLVEFRGSMQKKYCFWINASMIAGIVRENLGGPRSTRSGLMNPN